MSGQAILRPGVPPLPELALGAAAFVAIARLTGLGANLVSAVSPWLPIDPAGVDFFDALTGILALTALSIGVRRRKRLAWPIAAATFLGAAVAQVLVLHHPFSAALASACLLVLARDFRRFQTRSGRRMRLVALAVMVAGVLVLVLGSIFVDIAAAAAADSPLGTMAAWATAVLGFVDPSGRLSSGAILEALELGAQTAVLVAALAVLAADPERPAQADLERNRGIAEGQARGALAPFQIGPDKLLYAADQGTGIVAYGLAGRSAVLVGDPIGPITEAWYALTSFMAGCASRDVVVSVYQASQALAQRLSLIGFRTFRVGAEAIVALPTFDLVGSRRANLRHAVTRSRRAGVIVRWHPTGMRPDEIRRRSADLSSVDAAWRAGRGRAMRFTIGAYAESDLTTVGVALAIDAEDRVVAFATFRRTGSDSWVLDLTRRRSDAAPGALEACLAEAAGAMRAAGDRELSLGLVALMGVSAMHGSWEERSLAIARRLVGSRYSIEGLRFFKDKFDPEWAPRYGAARGRFGFIGFASAVIRLHLDIGLNRPPGAVANGASAGCVRLVPAPET